MRVLYGIFAVVNLITSWIMFNVQHDAATATYFLVWSLYMFQLFNGE